MVAAAKPSDLLDTQGIKMISAVYYHLQAFVKLKKKILELWPLNVKSQVVGPSSYVKVAAHHRADAGGDAWFLTVWSACECGWTQTQSQKAFKDLLEGCSIINNHSAPTNVRSVLEFLKCQNCFHSCKEFSSFLAVVRNLTLPQWRYLKYSAYRLRLKAARLHFHVSLGDTRETWPPETGNAPSE